MAGGKGDGDRSIGSRHILGLFFGVVVLCCIFFTLGYVMGRDQARVGVRGEPASKSATTETSTPPGWSVSAPASGAEGKTAGSASSESSEPPATPPVKSSATSASPKTAVAATPPAPAVGKFSPPLIPRGAIVLQIAALTSNDDALAMAGALQEKGFPAFVLTPGGDNFYRVQVGPFADAKSADQAKRSLEHEGFKPIVKH